MFSNEQVTIDYNYYTYTGNLNELIEVILTDVFMLTKKFEPSII